MYVYIYTSVSNRRGNKQKRRQRVVSMSED